jgi:hypothetical protein
LCGIARVRHVLLNHFAFKVDKAKNPAQYHANDK